MFDEAVDFGLEYAFSTTVTSIAESEANSKKGSTTVTTQGGDSFVARRVVCSVPLNVLKTIHFSSPLSPKRQEAINIGHVNFISKIHAVVEAFELTSWSGMQTPVHLLFGYGDGVTPRGDAHLVGFGADERASFVPERDPEKVVAAFNALHPVNLKKAVRSIVGTDSILDGVAFTDDKILGLSQLVH